MLSKILQRKNQIITVVSLFSGLAAGYYIYSKIKQSKSSKQKEQRKKPQIDQINQKLNQSKCLSETNRPFIQKWDSLYSEFYFDKNLQSRKVLDHLDKEGISVETIYKYSPLIAVDEYRKFTSEIRRRRRLIRTINQDQYIRLILDYEQEIDQLLERSREEIVYECQIDPDEFLSMKVIFEATEDLTALVRDAKKAIKEMGFTKKRAINKNTIQKIINEELSFIKVKLYDRLKNKLENQLCLSQDQVLRIIQAFIDDIIYQKYGYEKEEIEHSLTTQWNVELSKQIKQLKKFRAQLQSDIGNMSLLSQQSDNESEKGKVLLSQGFTRSAANSSIVDQNDI